jgi:HD-GYP domain-containing protein (c-di-GMP phosphodiesterase class II)
MDLEEAQAKINSDLSNRASFMKIGLLQIQNGPFEGLKYKFFQSITLGRDESNTIRLLDPKVSRSHARIDLTEAGFLIKDLKSTNGTFINGNVLKGSLLQSGDRIRLGATELLFLKKEIGIDEIDEEESPLLRISTKRKALDYSQYEPDERTLSNVNPNELRRRFQAIVRVNRTIGSELDIKRASEKVLEEIFQIFPADRGAILAVNDETGNLEIVSTRTRKGPDVMGDILISQTILNSVLEESVGLLIDDAMSDDQFSLSESVCQEDIRSALCVPLIQHKQIIGIIYLDVSSQVKAFSEADLDLLIAVASPASVQVQNALYMAELKKSYWDTIKALANAVDARDRYTIGHNWRVSHFAVAIASTLRWSENTVRLVELGGILHDIGKIGVSDAILLKSGLLDKKETLAMQRHPEVGARMIMGIDFLRPVVPYILYHHERWDGGGYPLGLKEKDIPTEGRLLALCDAFDAMITTRPYRKARQPDAAFRELVQNKGAQFDPEFVEAFALAYESGEITEVLKSNGRAQLPPLNA